MMEHETDTARGPDPADWLATALRGGHPVRWLLSVLGLVLSVLAMALVQALFNLEWPDLVGWYTAPATQWAELQTTIVGGSLGRMLFRGSVLLALLTMVWSPLVCWITRHELLARQTNSDEFEPPTRIAPTALVIRSLRHLLGCCPTVLGLTWLLLLPALTAVWLSNLGGIGANLVAVLLPVILITNLMVLLFALGAFAWPLMPTAMAAECSDIFDAMSRSYNYAYQRPFRFLFYLGCAVAIAAVPIVGFAYLEPLLNLPVAARSACYLVVFGLTLAVFASLQAVIYLHLRTLVDDVGADVLVDDSPILPAPTPNPNQPAAPTVAPPPSTVTSLCLVGLAVGTWAMTYGLFRWTSDDDAAHWLGWGFHEGFVPPVEGLYRIASLIALGWGVLWLLWPLVMYARALRKNTLADVPVHPTEPAANEPP